MHNSSNSCLFIWRITLITQHIFKKTVILTVIKLLATIVCAAICFGSSSQLAINEACPSNTDNFYDEFSETPDWIELYNGSSIPINIDNYTISDSENSWSFPNVTIPANDHLIIFASGLDLTATNLHASFKISRSGEQLVLRDPFNQMVDSIYVPEIQPNHSYGRQPDGGNFSYFGTPTPNQSNTTTAYLGYSPKPEFSNNPGFYNSSVNLELKSTGSIYYTTDGNVPNTSSTLYSAPLPIQQTTAISAISVTPGYLNSELSIGTFLINPRTSLPIFSIVTEPHLLFSDSIGIYMLGNNASTTFPYHGANFWQDWEIPVNIEFFTSSGVLGISQRLGMEMHGGSVSLTRPQKSFRFTAKDKYGDSDIDYPLFRHKPEVDNTKRFALRNTAGDFDFGNIRDPLVHSTALNFDVNIDLVDDQSVVVYINGAYWGILHLREKIDEHYIDANYNVDKSKLDFLEEDTSALSGSFADFDTLLNYVLTYDMTDTSLYKPVENVLDVNSMMDYFISQLYVHNTDWPQNNLKLWRERGTQYSKWRYIMFDLDGAYNLRGWTPPTANPFDKLWEKATDSIKHAQLFQAILQNDSVNHYFITRMADLFNTLYEPNHQLSSLHSFVAELEEEFPFHFDRWNLSDERFHKAIDERIPNFMIERPQIMRDQIQDENNLAGQVLLDLNVFPPKAGKIQVNTIQPLEYPWQGYYFNGVPVSLTAVPALGYSFKYWRSTNGIDLKSDTLYKNYTADDKITAYFSTEESPVNLAIKPNPNHGDFTISMVLSDIQHVDIHIQNTDGKLVKKFSTGLLNAGINDIRVSENNLSQGLYIVTVSSDQFRESIKVVIH